MLDAQHLSVRYGAMRVLHDVDFRVDRNEIVCILGPNGAGKSTLVNAVAGLVRHSSGSILKDGEEIGGLPAHSRVRHRISLVMERRRLFPMMTVQENLMLGRHTRRREPNTQLDFVTSLFPALGTKLRDKAGTLSGGQQQMVAIARGLMSEPDLLMLDEPYLGLAPGVVDVVNSAMRDLRDRGLGVVFIEQNVRLAMEVSDRAYLLANGAVAFAGTPHEAAEQDIVKRVYFGTSARSRDSDRST